jgi:hypothetical protein
VEDTCHKQAKAVNEGSGKRFVEGPIQNHSIPNTPPLVKDRKVERAQNQTSVAHLGS